MSLVAFLVGASFHDGRADSAPRTGLVKIGVLTQSWGATPQTVGLRDGLLALGYREGEQFVLGVRFTQGDPSALPAAAQDLVQSGVDVIFANDTNSARAAQKATSRIPIVFAAVVGDPVEMGLVKSFARPGGNITGVTDGDLDLAGKRLELFKELVPSLKRVLLLYDPNGGYAEETRVLRDAAPQLRLLLVEKPMRTEGEVQATLSTLRTSEVDGIVAQSSISLNIPGFVLDATAKRPIPTMFSASYFVERGGLISYGRDYYETGRQAARLVDKVIKGEDPGGIPVEANPKIELAINAKTAKALKLAIPPSVLQRAGRLIE